MKKSVLLVILLLSLISITFGQSFEQNQLKNENLVASYDTLGIVVASYFNTISVGNDIVFRKELNPNYTCTLVIHGKNVLFLYNNVEIYCYNDEILILEVNTTDINNILTMTFSASYEDTRKLTGYYNMVIFMESN